MSWVILTWCLGVVAAALIPRWLPGGLSTTEWLLAYCLLELIKLNHKD